MMGARWLTRNDGGTWEELTGKLPGVPPGTYVSRIEPSHADTNTFYVSFDNHRTGDYTPYVFVTTDYGKTFQSIVDDLPKGGPDFVHVVREDPCNRNVLFVGTDVGAYVSLDRGATWQRFMTGLPTVPVYDLKIHPRDHELIAATHGRAIWIVDINALSQITRGQRGDRADGVQAQGCIPVWPATVRRTVGRAGGHVPRNQRSTARRSSIG